MTEEYGELLELKCDGISKQLQSYLFLFLFSFNIFLPRKIKNKKEKSDASFVNIK